VTPFARTSAIAILALTVVLQFSESASAGGCAPCGDGIDVRTALLTKSYRMQPGFCAQQVAALVPGCLPAPPPGCGSYGIPPVYTAGNYVLVRHSPEGHELVAKFLADLGAYVPPKPLR
jgi:hypothetical protein